GAEAKDGRRQTLVRVRPPALRDLRVCLRYHRRLTPRPHLSLGGIRAPGTMTPPCAGIVRVLCGNSRTLASSLGLCPGGNCNDFAPLGAWCTPGCPVPADSKSCEPSWLRGFESPPLRSVERRSLSRGRRVARRGRARRSGRPARAARQARARGQRPSPARGRPLRPTVRAPVPARRQAGRG